METQTTKAMLNETKERQFFYCLTPEQQKSLTEIEEGFIDEKQGDSFRWGRLSSEDGSYVWADKDGNLYAIWRANFSGGSDNVHDWQIYRCLVGEQEFGWAPLLRAGQTDPAALANCKLPVTAQLTIDDGVIDEHSPQNYKESTHINVMLTKDGSAIEKIWIFGQENCLSSRGLGVQALRAADVTMAA